MRICRTGAAIVLSSAFSSAVAQRPALTSHVTVIARDGKSKKVIFSSPRLFEAPNWSLDGTQLAISAGQIFVLPFSGGTPRQVTEKPPGYFHGWSPDGRTLVYCARRDNNFDLHSISVEGGAEKLLTEDWFPHPSPDGKWLLFISFAKGTKGHPANQNVVLRMMRLPGAKPAPSRIKEAVRLFGGQGTINVSSWSPDSKRFAYVSYSLVQ